jgi:hypothetical protein
LKQLDDRTMSHLDAVLEEVCRSLPHGGDHDLRRRIAEKLLNSAAEGNKTLTGLTEVARAALAEETKEGAIPSARANIRQGDAFSG